MVKFYNESQVNKIIEILIMFYDRLKILIVIGNYKPFNTFYPPDWIIVLILKPNADIWLFS